MPRQWPDQRHCVRLAGRRLSLSFLSLPAFFSPPSSSSPGSVRLFFCACVFLCRRQPPGAAAEAQLAAHYLANGYIFRPGLAGRPRYLPTHAVEIVHFLAVNQSSQALSVTLPNSTTALSLRLQPELGEGGYSSSFYPHLLSQLGCSKSGLASARGERSILPR